MFNEIKKLLKHSAIYGIGALAQPIISFLMLPVYTRYLTPDDYGVLALTGVVSTVLGGIMGMGVRSGIVRIYFTYKEKEDRDSVITSSFIFSLFSTFIFAAILLLFFHPFAPILFDHPQAGSFYTLIILTLLFNVLVANLIAGLRSEEKSVIYTIVTTGSLILYLSLNIIFVVVLERTVLGILEAGLIGNFIVFIALMPLTLKGKKKKFSYLKIKEVLGFGIPTMPGTIAALILNLSDRYFLEYYHSLEEVGLYSIGYRIAGVLPLLINKPFQIAWPPYMFSVADQENCKDIYKTVLVYFVFISSWIALSLSLLAKEILVLITTEEYYAAEQVVSIIIVTYILVGMMSILSAGMHITKKVRYIGALLFVAASLNLVLNYLLIPGYGMMGAAVATFISFLFMNIAYFKISQRFYPIQHEFKRIFLVLIVAAGIFGLSNLIPFDDNLILSSIVKIMLIISFPFILFLTGFYKREELNKVRQILRLKIKEK